MYDGLDATSTVACFVRSEKTFKPRGRGKRYATGVWFYVPENLDLVAIGLGDVIDEARWLVHKIIQTSLFYKHSFGGSSDEWINISRQTLKQFIHPSIVGRVRNGLLNAGVIRCNGKYRKRCHSMGYRLEEQFRTRLVRVECGKRSLAEKMRLHRLRRHDIPTEERKFTLAEQHLIANLREVRIDRVRAYAEIDAAAKRRSVEDAKRCLTAYYKACNKMTVDTIADGDFDVAVCVYGRFHSPVTRLLSEARDQLFFPGHQPLRTIDIRNSQLVFLVAAMLAKTESDTSEHTNTHPTTNRKTITHTNTNPKEYKKPLKRSKDVVKFLNSTIAGTIYDELMSVAKFGRNIKDANERRKRFKAEFFKNVLFGDTAKPWVRDSELARVFRQLYPTVWEFICRSKRGDFRRLAHAMQRAESNFMYGSVVERLRNEHPEIPILTVHDSIICPANFAKTVSSVMRSEFERYLGTAPAFSVK